MSFGRLKHLTNGFQVAKCYQISAYIPKRCFSGTKRTTEELEAENSNYKKQIETLKNQNVELISKNLGCMSQINELRSKNAQTEQQIHDILSKGDAMSHNFITERVRYAHEVSTLTEHLWHLLSILAQNKDIIMKLRRENSPKPTRSGDIQQQINEFSAQIDTLQNQLDASKHEIARLNDKFNQPDKEDFVPVVDLTEDDERVITSSNKPSTSSSKNQSRRAVSNLTSLAKSLHRSGDYEDAFDLFTKAVEIEETEQKDPRVLSRLWFNISVVHQKLGRNEVALDSVNKAIEYQPGHTPNYFRRASVHASLGRKSEAIEDLKKVIEMDATNVYANDLLELFTRQE